MPLRKRLSNTGLKLKIPTRNSSNVAVSPYGPSPRLSASPQRKKEDLFPPPLSGASRERKSVNVFDASCDSRPVWEVSTHRTRSVTTDGFREIPITRTSTQTQPNDLIHCDKLDNDNVAGNVPDCEEESEPVSPALVDCKFSPCDQYLHRSPLRAHPERQLQRAEILRDWMQKLPIGSASTSNPFFSQRKRDFNYETYKYLSSPLPKFNQSPDSPTSSLGTSNDGSILTPTDIAVDPLSTARRDSSGVLQSPDVLDPAKEDGFYMLKKDSQRRTTLVKIMKDDKLNICHTWHSLLLRDVPDSCISIQHLSQLMEGVKAWLPDSNVQSLVSTISNLREALDFDGAKINHIQLALYLFQDAVNTVLRKHSIKPHWMFALDSLVRSAVSAAIGVLSPELGAHLGPDTASVAGPADSPEHPDDDQHDVPDNMDLDTGLESNSGVSTTAQSARGGGGPPPVPGGSNRIMSRLNRVRDDNRQLLTDLLRAQTDYHQLLRQSLEEQKLHLQMLSQNLAASHLQTRETREVEIERHVHVPIADKELVTWLQNLAIDERSVDVFINEDLTLNDVLELMSRDDLKRLGLKAGPELRIWRAILRHRGIPTTPTTPTPM